MQHESRLTQRLAGGLMCVLDRSILALGSGIVVFTKGDTTTTGQGCSVRFGHNVDVYGY